MEIRCALHQAHFGPHMWVGTNFGPLFGECACQPEILETVVTKTPAKTSTMFRVLLAAEKGYTSIVIVDGTARIVIASDARGIRFERP